MRKPIAATVAGLMLTGVLWLPTAAADGYPGGAGRESVEHRGQFNEYERCNLWNYHYHPEECACDNRRPADYVPFQRQVCRYDRFTERRHRHYDARPDRVEDYTESD